MNKRGMDAVIATVLLIAITIALIAAVYLFVVPWLQDIMGESKSCFDARIDVKSACYDATNGNISIMLGRGSETFELKKILVMSTNSTGTISAEITSDFLGKYEDKLYSVKSAQNANNVKVVLVLVDGTECGKAPVEKTVTNC